MKKPGRPGSCLSVAGFTTRATYTDRVEANAFSQLVARKTDTIQGRSRVIPQTEVLAQFDIAGYRHFQHQELGRRPAPTCFPSKVAFFLRKKMWPVRQLNGTSHHGVMRSSLQERG